MKFIYFSRDYISKTLIMDISTMDTLSFLSNLFSANWIQNFLGVIAIISSIGVYWHEQSKSRRETIIRSCKAVLMEIQENKNLVAQQANKIEYPNNRDNLNNLNNNTVPQKIIYTNAYLDTAAFDSLTNAGSFTHLSSKTQFELTMLYGRIKNHNEMLTYIDHYQDIFFLIKGNSEESKYQWFDHILRYDVHLTDIEKEIFRLLDECFELVNSEKNKQ